MKLFNRIKLKLNLFFKSLKKVLAPKFVSLNKKRRKISARFFAFANRKPFTAFILLLGILLLFIILSNVISKPKQVSDENVLTVKEVSVYSIGTSPKITLQAQVEKSGVIKIVSLGSGVVQSINVKVGQSVNQGTTLVSMSTNYQGGNAFTVQRQLAQAQYNNVNSTYNTQKDLINQQINLANETKDNSEELRKISNDSVSSTQSLIDLNSNIINSLNAQLSTLESTNSGGSNDQAILQTKQLIAQTTAGNNQLQQSLKLTQYNVNQDNPPTQMTNISKSITLDQLYIQAKALELSKEVSRLNLTLAQITEALMFPSSPISGTVERVFVKEGQAVNPGTPLVQISGTSKSLIAVAPISRDMASNISKSETSTIFVGNKSYQVVPFYVSTEATEGTLYSAQYIIPQEYSSLVTDKGYITINVPIGSANTSSAVPFVPLDAIYQTQDQAFLFVVKDGKAVSRKVQLGQVTGSFVEIKKGLLNSDEVILNRNVIEGDPVRISN